MTELLQARVSQNLALLKLAASRAGLDHHLRTANERELSHLEFLDALLADEITARQQISITVRTKLAHFPVLKTVDSFEFDAQPSLDRRVINELQTVAFVERAENVLLLGPPDPAT